MTTSGPAPSRAWYCFGQRVPQIPDFLGPACLQKIKEGAPEYDFRPTTWEAAEKYLKKELKKPEGGRDLLREMCMAYVVKIQGNQDIGFVSESTKYIVGLSESALMMYPTVDLPPDIFGTVQDRSSPVIVNMDPDSRVPPGNVVVLMTYLTRTAKVAQQNTTPENPNVITMTSSGSPYD